MRTAKYIFLTAFSVALALIGGWFMYKNHITEQFIQEGQERKILLSKSEDIWDLWRNGRKAALYNDLSNSCTLAKIKNDKCNQELLECVLKNNPLKVMLKGAPKVEVSKIEVISRFQNGEYAPIEGSRVVLTHGSAHLTLFLEKSCSKIYLPQRIYGFGPDQNPDANHLFDTFNRNIFIDKKANPSKGLSISQMKQRCNERGMQLLESHLLDAAAYHPVDLKNNRPLNLLRPKLPWTRRFKTEFVAKAQKDKKLKFENKFCSFLHSKECVTQENISLPSWMGLVNPLGGSIEVVRNIEKRSMRLVPSSIHFDIHSEWHLLGLRSSWDGESFDKSDFELKIDLDDYKKLETGYRCMQEEWIL